jgi:hypothetical protein
MSYHLHLCQCGRTFTYQCPFCHQQITAPSYAPLGDDGRMVPVRVNPENLMLWREQQEELHVHGRRDVASGVMV